MKRALILATALTSLASIATLSAALPAFAETPAPAVRAAAQAPYGRAEVMALAEKVADYQLATMAGGEYPQNAANGTSDMKGWVQGALFVGLNDLADHSDKPHYKQVILSRGAANKWELGRRLYHADDHVIGQSYLWAFRNGAGPQSIAHLKASFDKILANPSKDDLVHHEYTAPGGAGCDERWCWCDAIFMAPPTWLQLANATGDMRYRDFAKREFWAATEMLYDKEEHLYYRDSRFFDRRDINGRKVFWSRGDGWVLAGLARMIPHLPQGDADRARMETIFREMSAKLKTIQKPDGFWAPSLLGDPEAALPESSGTGFYVYALAWGVKAGILDRATYEPTIRKGWAALVSAVHDDGHFGYVQPISDRPDNVGYDDTQYYGVGAFLLAAIAVADLGLDTPAAAGPSFRVENPASVDQASALVSIPAPPASAAGWSVVSGSDTYAAQIDGDRLRFALPLKAGETREVRFVPQMAVNHRYVQTILNVQNGGKLENNVVKGGLFQLRKSYDVPADHFVHDGLLAFEGIGWESDQVAYRLYLDERYVTDIFGKKLPEPILHRIGRGADDYHAMADWGMDIFKVGNSLGIGGIGRVSKGKAVQLGKSAISARILSQGPVSSTAEVVNTGFADGKATLTTHYTISVGSALTFVNAKAEGAPEPIAAGFAKHKGVKVIRSDGKGEWAYVASWGNQSLANDGLGLILFYRPGEVTAAPKDDGQTVFVAFKDPANIRYAFAARWVQDQGQVKDQAAFKAWADQTLTTLNAPVRVTPN
ncbi:glycoside hydrolase family 88 protein [Asticcacaulis sp. AND118]|uniref:glycoside hydrolase family 88 protein n=1 Tax=Asticcacaulis sp. AND118 TaxID=2840468 RepID=UPI001D000142|nr:glycoside hydrolase family 88 protein [Asticcacaulis sp. AND118]UDF05698.1 glycoside hydrolase family 88 protein [Asticcacaulis sp. AND118]